MAQKHKRFRVNRYTASLLILLFVAVGAFLLIQHNQTKATPSPKLATKTTSSQFSFTGAPGWRKGPSNKTSMALFSNDQSCFTSNEYKTGTVDVAAGIKQIQDKLTGIGYTSTPGATQAVTLQSGIGQNQYELHQYTVTGSGSAGQVLGGQEFGYLQLSDGYIKIEGYCNTAEQLPTTIPALEAIKFDLAR